VNHHYSDITSRIDAAPQWWDENGAPRYCPFGPEHTANIYAREALLLAIQCQDCGCGFSVAMSWSWWPGHETSLRELVEKDAIHYGDPPNTGCCPAGPTMNSIPKRVLQFWEQHDVVAGWRRVPELEREVSDE
jgi:hypothetical protein